MTMLLHRASLPPPGGDEIVDRGEADTRDDADHSKADNAVESTSWADRRGRSNGAEIEPMYKGAE